ncbi:hypothetical protein DSO57_1000442 [Entomophthora muscae]|uniref:Uncharacterized protein n=1 Tax=Entomophthora muscae TaxID=34485 RepID=A0ACC2UJD0_9FUNG|nr:hypothetical protein DSO57_1000442 [Entomophthora muscae]
MPENDRKLFFSMTRAAQKALIQGLRDQDTGTEFSGMEGPKLFASQKKKVVKSLPKELQPSISEKQPNKEPAEERPAKQLALEVEQPHVASQLEELHPTPPVGSSGTHCNVDAQTHASADVFGNTQEPLHAQYQLDEKGFSFQSLFVGEDLIPQFLFLVMQERPCCDLKKRII